MKAKTFWVIIYTKKGRPPLIHSFVLNHWRSGAIEDAIKFFNGAYTWKQLKEDGYDVAKAEVRLVK